MVTVGVLAAPAAATPFTSPDGLWTWARPLPHGYPAQSISALVPGTLFATTSETDAMATFDGGTNWTWSRTSAVSDFAGPEGIQFVSANEGWSWGTDKSGLNGMLLHATDGGTTWQSNLALPNMPPLYVGFTSPTSGWVVAGDSLPESDGGFVLFTSDGGQTWSAPVALPQNSTIPDVEYITFAALAPRGGRSAVLMQTESFVGGDLAGTAVWRTSDGGATWSAPRLLKGADIVDATFSSAKVGWATDDYGLGWLWHTGNGGASWQRVRRTPGHARVATAGSNVWVVGHGALHSSNGGATWHSIPGLSGSLVSFSDPADGWITNGPAYLHTTDGGKTWRHVTSAPKPGITSLAAVSGETVWGAARHVIRSTDGGRHWRTCTKRIVTAVSAVSASQAWAVGPKGLVIHTADGGHHWKLQPSSVRVGLHDVFFVDARHGWAGGESGTLLRTTNGGRRWTHLRVAVTGTISQVVFADVKHGIALGTFSRMFLVTANGGRTWSKERLPAGRWPTVAYMQDASHVLIISLHEPRSYSFTSSDGGKTWQQVGDLPDGVEYSRIARSGSLLCAVDAGGGVASSRNDGATWTDDAVPMGEGSLNGVQFVGTDGLVIGGDLGVMTRNLTTAPLP
jgi:photosystem II stability/assembly factor-like uncharacterized protein